MAFLGLFGKIAVEEVFENFIQEMFSLYGVRLPSDAEQFRARIYTCVITVAVLDSFSKKAFHSLNEKLFFYVRESTKNYHFLAGEVVLSEVQFGNFLNGFERGHGVNPRTPINGYAAFLAFTETQANPLMTEITHADEQHFYSSAKLVESVFGAAKAQT